MSSTEHNITLERLIEGRKWSECSHYITLLQPLWRYGLMSSLTHERLLRKCNDITEVLRSTSGDWSQTLLIILFRFLGGTQNRMAAERLARIVTYQTIMRENSSLKSIEALLLGAAGLLDIYGDDEYVSYLRHEFDHLVAKYDITPMLPSDWQLSGIYLNNHPTLRIAQIAACLHNNRITMQNIIECNKRRDIYNLFSGQASDYWVMNFLPHSDTTSAARRMGSFKSDIMGINLVVPMKYAYGKFIGSDAMINSAIQLLELIPAEVNRYTKVWNSHDNIAKTAIDSQALIQLSREYCERSRCSECRLARKLLAMQERATK